MSQTHRDHLIASLPADLQARMLKVLHGYSPDGNDVVEALFSADYEIANRNTAILRDEILKLQAALVALEAREKIRDEEQKQNTRNEVRKVNPDKVWKRMLVSSAVTIIGSILIGFTLSAVSANKVMAKVAADAARMLAKQEALTQRQTEMLDRVTNDPGALVALVQNSRVIAESVSNTAQAMAPFARSMHERGAMTTNKDGTLFIHCEDIQLIQDKKWGPTIQIGPPKNKDKSKLERDHDALEEAKRNLSK